jgi:hypothetical protein
MPIDVVRVREERRLSFSGACEDDKTYPNKLKFSRRPLPLQRQQRKHAMSYNRGCDNKEKMAVQINDENSVTISREMLFNPCPRRSRVKPSLDTVEDQPPGESPTSHDTPIVSAVATKLDRQITYLERQLAESNHRSKVPWFAYS